MGIAVTDLKNDGLPDFFFSNVGSTVPDTLVRGDLTDDQVLHKEWILFENQGDFTFTDVAARSQVADFEFSWGAIFEDFNLDGRDDLVVSETMQVGRYISCQCGDSMGDSCCKQNPVFFLKQGMNLALLIVNTVFLH